jgi:vacuolar-type H+-ATPase catalytic subunit A/Vma1
LHHKISRLVFVTSLSPYLYSFDFPFSLLSLLLIVLWLLLNNQIGEHITGGDVFGKVYETSLVVHWIMLPPKAKGTIVYLAPYGHYTITEEVLTIEFMGSHQSFTMMHEWPVRQPRPFAEKMPCDTPLYTGLRVLDTFFPLGQGGTCAIPGYPSNADWIIVFTLR